MPRDPRRAGRRPRPPGRPQAGRPADARARHRGRLTSGQAPLQDDDPAKEAPSAPDLVRRSSRPRAPIRLWVADITYVSTWEGYLFLACVIDAWSRRSSAGRCATISGGARRRRARDGADPPAKPQPGLVHHSDRGSQYTSLAFGKTMQDAGRPAQHGPPRRCLRQCGRRELLRDARDRTARPAQLPAPATRPGSRSSTDRGLLQRPPPALHPRPPQPRASNRS